MKLKGNTGYLAGLTLLLSLGFLVLWEFWLETIILVDYLEIEVHKNDLDRWTFIVSCLSIVCLSLVLPFQSMKRAVDEMKSMETALHGEQTLSKVFFTVDNSIILVIDTANSIMQINDKAASLLGYKEEELLGHDWISLLVPDKSRDAVKNQYKQFINDKSQNLLHFSAPVKTKGGTEKMIDWQCSPLKDERDKVYGTINSGQDISESMRLRNELSHIKEKFEPQIKKLTADLNFNKKKYHSEAIKSANARARFKFWFDLETTLISLTPQELNTPEEVNKRIKKALQLFGEMTNVDQGYIFNFTQDGTHMVNTHLWVSGEPLLEPDPDDEISLENFPWFKKQMQKKEVIHLPKITDMPEEASSEMEVYVSQGIKSLINAPIIQNDSVIGYIGFESNQKERTWDQDEINVVQVMGRLISSLMSPSASTEPQMAAETEISMEPQLELEVPELSMEGPEPVQKPTQETAPSLKKELKAAKAAFEKELQEKVNEMEQSHSNLLAELNERKQVEADLRTSRDAIERQLGEKSLQLEKLLAEAGAGAKEKSSKESKAGVPGTPGKTGPDEIQKENEVMRNALQKKETELASLRSQLKSQVGGLTASEIEDFQEKISDKDLEISTLRKSFEKEQSARAKLKKQLSLLQESISDQGGETESLQAANQVLEAELEELRSLQVEFNASADQLENTQRELESLEIANEQLITDIEERNHLIEEAKEKAKRYDQIARDIRKRKEAEIQLVESQEKYNRFMDAESNAVLIIDGNTKRIMECNPAAPRLYGYEPQEFLNVNFKDLIADADPSGNSLSPASGLGSIQKASHLYQKRKDGTLFPANVTTSSFRLKNVDYEMKIISSISEQMELEEKLKEARDEFERYVETQGGYIDQITLEKEEQRIALREEKLNAVEHISASMVDLVKNPIQGIENILEQVKEKARMEDIHKGLVTVAMNECRRVGELIGKLKNYQPPAPEDLEPLDVHQVIDEILQSNMDTLNHRTITLEKEYATEIPPIDGVTQQIRQAIHNIIKNAEESFTHDEGKITISTEQDGSHVKIHIKDNGCGIPEKDVDRIFDPFYTTKSALHRPGLGLLASLGIIKNHQGKIDVHSRPGEGTTFTVTLPFKQAKNPNNGQF
ncbi:MAG: PAS domain S-box protein [Nitrospinae bacterium]|nr:PAS domain S-box protein [Nitrospinota bacterium]